MNDVFIFFLLFGITRIDLNVYERKCKPFQLSMFFVVKTFFFSNDSRGNYEKSEMWLGFKIFLFFYRCVTKKTRYIFFSVSLPIIIITVLILLHV